MRQSLLFLKGISQFLCLIGFCCENTNLSTTQIKNLFDVMTPAEKFNSEN